MIIIDGLKAYFIKGTIIKVLIVDDDGDDVLLARKYLLQNDHCIFEPTWESNATKARERIL